MNIELIIDPEFVACIPPLSQDEFEQLEENILSPHFEDLPKLRPFHLKYGIFCPWFVQLYDRLFCMMC